MDDNLKWWQKTNVYEIYVNSFQDSDGDGYGDLNGITSRLDYLKELKVGAIWLTPVYESPMVDNGYDVADYKKINPRYGTMQDMEHLIFEAKKRGIRVVMDLVYNHTSDQNKWFIESAKSRTGKYSDWYIWRDPAPDGGEPNNWRGIFGGSAWTWCEARGQYYLHTFAAQQPDLNWENPEVRKALYDIARFWIGKGAGGFRMDAIPYIEKPVSFADGPVDDTEGRASIHDMTVNTPGILDFLHEFKNQVIKGHDVFTVGEANGISADQLDDWVGENGVFDMLFEFSHSTLAFKGAETWCKPDEWTLKDLKKALRDSQAATADNGWYPIYFENHDRPRSIDFYFGAHADRALAGKALGTVLLTLRGTPFLYQGEELGMTNVHWDQLDTYDDLNTRSQYEIALKEGFSPDEAMRFVHRFSRDNARTPMQWDGSEHAGFTNGVPWLPVNENYTAVNAELQSAQPDSVLNWYRGLAAFRCEHPVLTDGRFEERMTESDQIYAFTRTDGSEKLLIVVNFSGEDAVFSYDALGIGGAPQVLLSSYGFVPAVPDTLRPYEAMVVSY
ncbi:MAG: alpha-glucosidase [Lachnospiraceae bacterium]|nr:alpha-glucosidase [Lachnospiraceae bacterium]